MCCLVALLFSFNAVVAETRLLFGFDAVIAENYSQLPLLFGHLAEPSRRLARVQTPFLGLAFPKMLPAEHFVRRLPAYPRLRQPLVVS
jgi:hypothetical protein